MTPKFLINKGSGVSKNGEGIPTFIVSRTNNISAFISFFTGATLVVNPKIIKGESSVYDKVISYDDRGVLYITEDVKKELAAIIGGKSENTLCLEIQKEAIPFVRKNSDGKKINTVGYKVDLIHVSRKDDNNSVLDSKEGTT